jgi:hypothetical protein
MSRTTAAMRWLAARWPWWLVPLVATVLALVLLSLLGGRADDAAFLYPVQGAR